MRQTNINSLAAILGMLSLPLAAPSALAADGKAVFDKTCRMCHLPGIAGAPKLGDKAAWAERSAKGLDVLVENAIKGFQGTTGVMPPRGGNPKLSDEEVKAAVEYMVGASK